MCVRGGLVVLGAAVVLQTGAAAQESPALGVLLDRLGRYLSAYEEELSTVVAAEEYLQEERLAKTGRAERRRKLESDVAFLRLPDGGTWFGVRDVRKVNGRPVENRDDRAAVRLLELIKKLDGRSRAAAQAIVVASAKHNLGTPRTINMPTTPLEILHPEHHVRFAFRARGHDTIATTRTTRLDFEELHEPTLIHNSDGASLFIRGTAWIEQETGRLWRAELTVVQNPKAPQPVRRDNRLQVDYMFHSELQMMVPRELNEEFYSREGSYGVGRARYSHFRRFTTAARIIPNLH